MKVYQQIASSLSAMHNCEKSGNTAWYEKHKDTIDDIVTKYLPRGSGFDSGTQIDYERSTPNKIVFGADFHHMDENGYYDGWSEHDVIITPSLAFGFTLKVTGRNRDNIKEYIVDVFHDALSQECEMEDQ